MFNLSENQLELQTCVEQLYILNTAVHTEHNCVWDIAVHTIAVPYTAVPHKSASPRLFGVPYELVHLGQRSPLRTLQTRLQREQIYNWNGFKDSSPLIHHKPGSCHVCQTFDTLVWTPHPTREKGYEEKTCLAVS